MTSSLFRLPSLPCLVPEPQRCKCGVIPGEFFPCSRDFPWQADSLQLLSCAPASKPKSNLKKDKILQAAGCRGFSVSVRIMWQWHSSNRNQKACNVSPCCSDKKKKKERERNGTTARNAPGHRRRVAVMEIYEGENAKCFSPEIIFTTVLFTAANCQQALDYL